MCVGSSSSTKGPTIFDKIKAANQAGKPIDIFGKPAQAPPIQKIIDTAKKKTDEVAAANETMLDGNVAQTAVYGDRIEASADGNAQATPSPIQDLFGVLSKLTGIRPVQQQDTTLAPNSVAAGRIGHAYGASDLRIGRH
jgi:hypothetical protein